MNPLAFMLIVALRAYQLCVSPLLVLLLGGSTCGCRFQPTCSQYAIDAVRTHGAFSGLWLAARRLGRCHPWGGCGEDPVPLPHRHGP